MVNSNAFALRHSDLNGFLFADIGPESNGMTLTVVSLLARLGADPWREAERLSTLPAGIAASWLQAIIAAMPSKLWSNAEAEAIALRLVTRLPLRNRAPT